MTNLTMDVQDNMFVVVLPRTLASVTIKSVISKVYSYTVIM